MRIIHSKYPLPRNWRGLPGADRAMLLADIWITPRSRLRMKLIVFKSNRDMSRFYRLGFRKNDGIGRDCLGFVNRLSLLTPSAIEVDPRYFAMMCLVATEISMEVVVHESVHAAHAYAARVRKLWPDSDNPEERICYPAGRIAKRVNTLLHDEGLYAMNKGLS